MLAYLAYVPPAVVAAEAMRLAAFRAPALGDMTIGVLLLTAISSLRDGSVDSGRPHAITLRRGPQGESIAFDAITLPRVEGMIFIPPNDVPAPPVSAYGACAISVKIDIETSLPGILLVHLAELLGPLSGGDAGDSIAVAVGHEPAAARPN